MKPAQLLELLKTVLYYLAFPPGNTDRATGPYLTEMNVNFELRPLLQTCTVIISTEECEEATTDLTVDVNEISLTASILKPNCSPSCVVLSLPLDYQFEPESLSLSKNSPIPKEHKCRDSAVSHRKITCSVHVKRNLPSEIESCKTVTGDELKKPVAGCPYMFSCRKCGRELLVRNSVFRRVLPMPSADWKEVSAEWFCHKHDGEDDIPIVLCPKPDELFVLVSHFHVHESIVQGVGQPDKRNLACDECKTVLAKRPEDESDSVAILRTRIDVVCWKEKPGRRLPREDVGSVIRGFMKEQLVLGVTCRLILESVSYMMTST